MKTHTTRALTIVCGVACACLALAALPARAQTAARAATPTPKDPAVAAAEESLTAQQKVEQDLRGLGFGAGIAAIFMGGKGPVESAAVGTDGLLRVERRSNRRIAGVFEAHYLFGDARFGKGNRSAQQVESFLQTRRLLRAAGATDGGGGSDLVTVGSVKNDFAWGPTVCAELGESGFRSVGVGVLASFRRFQIIPLSGETTNIQLKPRGLAFNLGVLAMIEPDVKDLAGDLTENAPLPAGSAVRFSRKSRTGFAVVFSAGF